MAALGYPGGVPVGDLSAPAPDGAGQPVDLCGHGGVLQVPGELVHGRGDHLGVVDVIDRAQGLFGVPGVADLSVGIAGIEQAPQPDASGVGDLLGRGDQELAGPIQRVVRAAAMAQVWFWTRRRTSSSASLPNPTTWKGSATWRASGTAVSNAAR